MHRFREEKAACGTFQIKVCHSMTETDIVPGEKISLWFEELGLYPTEIFERF